MWTRPHDAEGRDWTDAATNQGLLRTVGQHRRLERGKEGFYPESQRWHGLASALALDFKPPKLEDNFFF